MTFILILAAVLLVIDQLSKYFIADYFISQSITSIPVINNVLYITYTQNKGAAFGMLQGAMWVFIPLTVLACAGLIYWLIRTKKRHWLLKLSSALILSGAVGNFIDRVFLGYVRDFIHVNINFAIFNIADSCLVVGSILFGIYLLFIHEKFTAKPAPATNEPADGDNK